MSKTARRQILHVQHVIGRSRYMFFRRDKNLWSEYVGQIRSFLTLLSHFNVFNTLARSEPLGTTQLVSVRLWLITGEDVHCVPANLKGRPRGGLLQCIMMPAFVMG